MKLPKAGEKYVHFRGEDKVYEIVAIARDNEDYYKKDVIYKQLYETEMFSKGTIWRRSLEDFLGHKQFLDGSFVKRFKRID